MKYFKTTDKAEVNNYPYGYLKTTAFFSLEFKNKKGFRSVFQTVNPKTSRINNPKKSTYYPLIIMIEKDNGHIGYIYGGFNGADEINKTCKVINEQFELFTKEQIEYFYINILSSLKIETIAIIQYCGADLKNVIPIIEPIIKIVSNGLKTGENLFNQIIIDIDKLNSCKVPDFNPFRVTEYSDVIKNGLNNPVVTQISDHDKRNGETLETIQHEENLKSLLRNSKIDNSL
jgi:hypothetical protein